MPAFQNSNTADYTFYENDVISLNLMKTVAPSRRIQFCSSPWATDKGARARAGKLLAGDGRRVQRSAGRFRHVVGREAPVTLEIGFGMGASSRGDGESAPGAGFRH